MNHASRKRWLGLLAALVLAALVFTLWPGLDLWFTGLFHAPGAGFPLARSAMLEAARNAVWDLSIALWLLSLVGLVLAVFGRRLAGVGARVWGFVFTLYLLGPGLLVNGLLKQHWGRARPADVTEFGGALHFTPALIPSDQCSSNCSFVSGEGSAAVVLGIALLTLRPALAGRLPGWALRPWGAAAVLLPVAALLQRIATGRHFLSDSVFAALFVCLLALVLGALILQRDARRS
ncbi:phosphatase PAP2 family protein [Frigidibacter sp. SD6-1]|uniref:phosphatase PAP2 family protein n=1 Tax=Frigidibacter sp. SD6-1 TaxID=3032581 RepID=UPI0024DFE831|nr:phosphatase PAP2 family protein [Frigidibacter sp. SD6-1]